MKKSFISFAEFSIKHKTSYNYLYVTKCSIQFPDYIFQKSSKVWLVDESWFLRRVLFKKKVWLASHDMYYFITKAILPTNLAYFLNLIDKSSSIDSWNNFLTYNLFTVEKDGIFNYKITGMMYKFFRYCRWIIQMLFKKLNIPKNKRSLDILLSKY